MPHRKTFFFSCLADHRLLFLPSPSEFHPHSSFCRSSAHQFPLAALNLIFPKIHLISSHLISLHRITAAIPTRFNPIHPLQSNPIQSNPIQSNPIHQIQNPPPHPTPRKSNPLRNPSPHRNQQPHKRFRLIRSHTQTGYIFSVFLAS